MRVEKWGDSLAVRIPESLAETLHLKEGDDVEVAVTPNRPASADDEHKRQEALRRIANSNWKLPEGYRFRRSDAYYGDKDE